MSTGRGEVWDLGWTVCIRDHDYESWTSYGQIWIYRSSAVVYISALLPVEFQLSYCTNIYVKSVSA